MASAPATAAVDHSPPVHALTSSYQSGTVARPDTRSVTVSRNARFASHSADASAIRVSPTVGNGWRSSRLVSAARPASVRPAPTANSTLATCQDPRCRAMRATASTPRAVHTGYSDGMNAAISTATPPAVSTAPVTLVTTVLMSCYDSFKRVNSQV